MGCDIHGVIQRRINGVWETTDLKFPNKRNYHTFAVLANVRNGYGFADIKTGDAVRPIAEPRGLPDGVVKDGEYADELDFGDHSFSHVTLREVVEYEWDCRITRCGVLNLQEWFSFNTSRAYNKDAEPYSYSGGVGGGGTVKITDEEAKERFKLSTYHERQDMIAANNHVYVTCEWTVPISSGQEGFLAAMLPLVKYGLDDVRLVFGFDS